MPTLRGSTAMIDAIGTPTAIAKKIIEREGAVSLAFRENHSKLLEDIHFCAQQEILTRKASE